MEIHKPKPWHGWREFLKEYLIIVVGVLTALALEQAVEWLHWHHQAHAARAALSSDLQRVLFWAAERRAEAPCIARRLEQVTEVLDQASASGRLPPMGDLGSATPWPWDLRSWESLTSGGTLAHLPEREVLAYSQLQVLINTRAQVRDQEYRTWATLNTMSGPGRRLGETEQAQLRDAVSAAAIYASTMGLSGVNTRKLVLATGLVTPEGVRKAEAAALADAQSREVCRPVGLPSARSGGALGRLQKDLAPIANLSGRPGRPATSSAYDTPGVR
jgi:hypothetical protein